MNVAICSSGLTRSFRHRVVVEGLDLAVREGVITAFLGPNGAGKTTTIRLLLGLLRPQAGTCEVLGRPPGHPEALAQLGAMVETPSLYDHLTGRENLEITRLMRAAERSEVDRVLALVDLARDARRPVREYSLGMRQRLGVALALMGNPRLLILDEPTNGLDPVGIQEMRELIRGLPGQTGATIFISSHILAEIEQVATDVVVIHRGRLKYQGPMEALGGVASPRLRLRAEAPEQARVALQSGGWTVEEQSGSLWVSASSDSAPRVAEAVVRAGAGLLELAPHRENLEARFMALLEEP